MHLLAPVVLLGLLAYGSTASSSHSDALSKAYKSLYAFGDKYDSVWFNKLDTPNAAYSPLLIWLSLSLLYKGSGGSTETALKSALEAGRKDDHIEAAKSLKKELSNLFEDDKEIYNGVDVSNALFIAEGITIKPEFLEVARNFPAYTPRVTFPDDPQITDWAIENFAGHVPKPNADSKLVVASALRLRGEVTGTSISSDLLCERFFSRNEEVIPRRSGQGLPDKTLYESYALFNGSGAVLAENNRYKVLSLPFHKTNKKLQLHIVMDQAPAADFPPPAAPGADHIDIEQAVKSAKNVNYNLLKVKLPRIHVGDPISVDEILQDEALGLNVLYNKTDVNFEQISDSILPISHFQSWMQSSLVHGALKVISGTEPIQKESLLRASDSRAVFIMKEFNANRALQYMVALHDSGDVIPIVKGIHRGDTAGGCGIPR